LSVRITKGTTPTKGEGFVACGVNYIKSESITADGSIDVSKFAFIDAQTHDKLSRSKLCAGNVLFSMAGVYLGKTAVVLTEHLPANTNQAVGIITLDESKADPYFIHFSLQSPACRSWVLRSAAQSAQPNFNLQEIGDLKIPAFSLVRQKEIASVLRALNDRITLLRETNATLEAIAQALFKSWFVDFDPVHAKQQGIAPEGMDDATAALFPDSFEGSELGLVPRGWRTCAVYDLATYINGAAYKAFEPNLERRGWPIIKIAELKAGVTSQTAYSDVAMPEKYRIETGDILFSWSGNPDTSIDTFIWHHSYGWLNQHIFRVIPHVAEERSFVLQILRYLRPTFAELARNKQTTGLGHVTVADMKRLYVIQPDKAAMGIFNETVSPVHARIFENEVQAQTLATLRDTLLPRLISGQLRLPEVEAQL
jgi:type I restriction enzyme S subunit